MKTTLSLSMTPSRSKAIVLLGLTASAIGLLPIEAPAASLLSVNLGSAAGFAVLAGSGITIASPANSSSVTGDIGSHATATISGLENLVLSGTNHGGDTTTQAAKSDLMVAYLDAASRPASSTFADGHNLSGTLLTGVYKSLGTFSLGGQLLLDAEGDSSAVWIFQMATAFNVASPAQVILTNGALASNVFWQVGSSATLDVGARLAGTILADQSITLNTGAVMNGAALARIGTVTMDANTLTAVPEPSSGLIVTGTLIGLLAFKRHC